MNPHFRKGGKAKQGSGHLWVLADYDKEDQLSHVSVQHQSQQNQPEQPKLSHDNANQQHHISSNITERVTGPTFPNPIKQYTQSEASFKVKAEKLKAVCYYYVIEFLPIHLLF